jgi:DNA processing protein
MIQLAGRMKDIQTLDSSTLTKILAPKMLVPDVKTIELIKRIKQIELNVNQVKEIKSILKQAKDSNLQIVTCYDKTVPAILEPIRHIYDIVFIRGQLKNEDIKSVSIAGSRNGSAWGLNQARKIGRNFAENNFTMINGFARGVDINAIEGALEVGGRCIAVLGSGVCNIYPEEHEEIAADVLKKGAIISQRFPSERVTEASLQIRNRFTSGLVLGNIYIEGGHKSGTKWQYKFSKEQNKPNFFLDPIEPNRECAQIPNFLKKEGATQINSDLSNMNQIIQTFEDLYKKRMKNL